MTSTVLSDLVREWGNTLLQQLTEVFYGSPLFQTILYLVGIVFFVTLARNISRGEGLGNSALFFGAWLLVLPINQRPVYYELINTTSVATSDVLQKAMVQLLTFGNTRKTMPPGFVFNAVIKASAAEITDPSIRTDIRNLIDQCLPDVKNKDGKPLSAMDLFGGRIQSSDMGVDAIVLNFDPQLLRNRTLSLDSGQNTNCLDLLSSTRKRLRAHLKGQELTSLPPQIYRGPNSGEFTDKNAYLTTWDATSSKAQAFSKIAVNLAEAHAVQKAVLEDYFEFSPQSKAGQIASDAGALSPLTTLSSHAFSGKRTTILGMDFDPTRVVADIANYPTAIAKSMNLDGAISAGLTLHEMNERLVKLPYYISNIQMVLKLIAPLVIFLLFFPKAWGIVAGWSIAWFVSLLVPTILLFTRSLANMIIIWTTKLEDVTATHMSDPAFLNVGVSFAGANNLMRDAGYWMSVFLEVENGVWNALFLGMPVAGGLLVHFKGSQFVKRFGEASLSTVGREAGRGAVHRAGSVARGAAAHAFPYAAGGGVYAASLAGKAFSKVTKFARGKGV